MSQKRVSFKVAKAIAAVGYPQNPYDTEIWYKETGEKVISDLIIDEDIRQETSFAAPTYIDVWFWLWREKGIKITYTGFAVYITGNVDTDAVEYQFNDPEEAIAAAIEHLVDLWERK